MRVLSIMAVTVLLLWGAPLAAQKLGTDPLGQRFISLCKSPNTSGRDACGGVVNALMRAHVEMARQNPNERVICPPRMLTVEESRRVFLQWADQNASAQTMRFPHLVMEALTTRYPCAQYKTPK
jgi:hypothetical protein